MKLDALDKVREKARRLGQDVDPRAKDRLDEARERLEVGKQVLRDQLDRAAATQLGDAARSTGSVGKITRTMIELAPSVIDDLDRAKSELVDDRQLAKVAPRIDAALAQLGIEEPLLGDLVGGLGAGGDTRNTDEPQPRPILDDAAKLRAMFDAVPVRERTIVPKLSAAKARTLSTQLAATLSGSKKLASVLQPEVQTEARPEPNGLSQLVPDGVMPKVDAVIDSTRSVVETTVDKVAEGVESIVEALEVSTDRDLRERVVGRITRQVDRVREELAPGSQAKGDAQRTATQPQVAAQTSTQPTPPPQVVAQQAQVAPQTDAPQRLAPIATTPRIEVRTEPSRSTGLGLAGWFAKLDLDDDREIADPTLASLPTSVAPVITAITGATTPSVASSARTSRSDDRTTSKVRPEPRTKPAATKPTPLAKTKPAALVSTGPTQTTAVVVKPNQPVTVPTPTPRTPASLVLQPILPPPVPTQEPAPVQGKQRLGRALGKGRQMLHQLTRRLDINSASTQLPQQAVQRGASELSREITEVAPRVVGIATKQQTRPRLADLTMPIVRTQPTVTPSTEISIAPTQPQPEVLPKPVRTTTFDGTTAKTELDGKTTREEQQITSSTQTVENAPVDQREQLAKLEADKVKAAEHRAKAKLAADKVAKERRENQRRANTSRKATTARTQASRHTRNRKSQVSKKAVDQVALLEQQFATFKQAQENRLVQLLEQSKTTLASQFAESKTKQLTALTTGREQIVGAQTRERTSLDDRIKREKALEDQKYATGCTERKDLATKVKANHTTIKNDAVRDANKICTDGCADFHRTGERLANEAIATANREAEDLLSQGRQAAQAAASRARSAQSADAKPGEVERAANAASKTELAGWQTKARERRAQGQTEAKQIRADYKAKADQLKLDTREAIKQHEASEQREHAAEDKQCTTDLETLEKIRVAAHTHFDSVVTDFEKQCKVELDAYDDHVQTQTAVILKEVDTQHREAVKELETDHAQKIEGVKIDVTTKLAAFETKLKTATTRDIAGLYKELGTLQKGIDDQVLTVVERSFSRSATYSKAADQKVADITTRAFDAVRQIEHLGRVRANAYIEGYKDQAQRDRNRTFDVAKTRAQNSYLRQQATAYNSNYGTLKTDLYDQRTIDSQVAKNRETISDANQVETTIRPQVSIDPYLGLADKTTDDRNAQLGQETKQNYLTRRELKTGQTAVTPETAAEKRTEVLTAIAPTDIEVLNGKSDPGKALALLGTLTREELLLMYPEGSEERRVLLEKAYKVGISDELNTMLGGNSNDKRNGKDPRAIALDWALRNGDARVANNVLGSLTTDEERAAFDQTYQKLREPKNPPVRDAFANLPEQQRKEVAVTWDAGRTFWNNEYVRNGSADLTDQWNQERSRKEAIETVNTYSGADKNKLLTLRSEMYKRHAGPYLDGADAQRHKEALQKELETFDSTVFNVSGQSMETLDTKNTTGKVQEALLSTSRRVVIDPNEPDFTRPEADWTKFGVALMQRSIEKNQYDTRLAEKFLKDLPADRRREFLANYQQQNQTSFIDDINANVRTSQAVRKQDDTEVSWKKAKLGDPSNTNSTTPQTVPASEIDADSLISIANTGEVPDPLRLMQLKNGRGRGDDEDQKEFASTLNRVSGNNEKFQLTTQQYAELAKKYNLPTTGSGRDDLIRDANELLQPRQARKAEFEMLNPGAIRNAEWDKQRRDFIWSGDTRPEKNSLREALEGPAGREVYSEKERLDQELEQLRRDGTAKLTREELAEMMAKGDPPPFDQAALERFTKYAERSESLTTSYDTMRTSYEENVRYAQMFVATGVVVVGTIVLTGPLGPVVAGMVSGAAGGLTTLGIKKIAFGKDYSSKELRNDVNGIIVDAVVGGIVAGGAINLFAKKLVGRVSQKWARELLAEAISSGITSGGSELTKALLDPDTYVGTPDQVRDRLLKRVRNAALGGALQAGTKSALTTKAQMTIGGDKLGKGLSTGIEVTSNVAGQIPTAKSLSDVVNAALGGLSAYNNGKRTRKTDDTDQGDQNPIARRDDGALEVTSPDLARQVEREARKVRSDESSTTYEVDTDTGPVQVRVDRKLLTVGDTSTIPKQLGEGETTTKFRELFERDLDASRDGLSPQQKWDAMTRRATELRANRPELATMTDAEIIALAGMHTGDLVHVNKGLSREGSEGLQTDAAVYGDLVDRALSKLPSEPGTFRRRADLSQLQLDQLMPGVLVKDPALVPISDQGINTLRGAVEIEIHAINAKRISLTGKNPNDNPLMMKSNTVFEVVSVDGRKIVLREVPNPQSWVETLGQPSRTRVDDKQHPPERIPWDGGGMDRAKIDLISRHLNTLMPAGIREHQKKALERLAKIASGEIAGTEYDRRWFFHEYLEIKNRQELAGRTDLNLQQVAHYRTIRQMGGIGDNPYDLTHPDLGYFQENAGSKTEAPKPLKTKAHKPGMGSEYELQYDRDTSVIPPGSRELDRTDSDTVLPPSEPTNPTSKQVADWKELFDRPVDNERDGLSPQQSWKWLERRATEEIAKGTKELQGMTKEEVMAIIGYTTNDGGDLSKSQVGIDRRPGIASDTATYSAMIESAFRKLPDQAGTFNRMVTYSPALIALYQKGARVVHPNFVSTSMGSFANLREQSFTGNVEMILNVKSGKRIDFLSNKPNEAEILLPPNVEFVVDSVTEQNGRSVIVLTEVEPTGEATVIRS